MNHVIVQIFVGAALLGGLVLCYLAVVIGKEDRSEGRRPEPSAPRTGR